MFSIGLNQLQERSVIFLLTLFSGLLACPFANATTFYERPFAETVQDAPTVVRGIIGNSYTDWVQGQDGTKRIYTFFDVQISEVLKGSATNPTLVLRQVGGEKDGVGLQIAGTASFERGEDVLVFASARNADGSYELLSMSMGKLNFEKSEDGHEYLVGAAIPGSGHDTHFHENGTGGHPDPSEGSRWDLNRLRKLIREQESKNIVQNQPIVQGSGKPEVVRSIPASAAPQLQPPSQDTEVPPPAESEVLGYVWRGLVVLLLLGFVIRLVLRPK